MFAGGEVSVTLSPTGRPLLDLTELCLHLKAREKLMLAEAMKLPDLTDEELVQMEAIVHTLVILRQELALLALYATAETAEELAHTETVAQRVANDWGRDFEDNS